jgi:hypothetical protein
MTDSSKVKFESKDQHLRVNSYIPNNQWDLVSLNVSNILASNRYNFFNEPNNWNVYKNFDVSFNFVLKRVSLYFMLNDIFPTLILNLITLLAFAMPYPQQLLLSKYLNLNYLSQPTFLFLKFRINAGGLH